MPSLFHRTPPCIYCVLLLLFQVSPLDLGKITAGLPHAQNGGFGAINCVLPPKGGGTQSALTIRIKNDGLFLNDEAVTPDVLSARLKKLSQESYRGDVTILVISAHGATITNFVKVLVLFWEAGRPGTLCVMEEN